ncbi:MAG: UvrD-helicase domain-containing protein [Trueperaceae bacterium]|nr:UvrD-helicase domain-containing protein [Trueperaceae bacterium]
MPMRSLDDAAHRLEALRNHDANVVIEAGAGSGKTAIMSGRVVTLLASGVPPASIAAITFTDAAGAQLANAVHEHVASVLDDPQSMHPAIETAFLQGGSDEQRRHLRHASKHLDRLTVGTIHSFAREILMAYPVESDIDPGATVLDKSQADALFGDVLDVWLRDRLHHGATDDVLVRTVHAFGARAVTLLRTIAHELRWSPDAVAPVGEPLDMAVERMIRAARDVAACEGVVGYSTPKHDWNVARLKPVVLDEDFVRGDVWTVLRHLSESLRPFFRRDGSQFKKRINVISKEAWRHAGVQQGRRPADRDATFAHVADAYAAMGDAIAKLAHAASDHLISRISADMMTLQRRYEEAKAMRAVIDFDDLIRRARDLLASQPDVRAELAERFRYVLIDEFQDTDEAQAEIIWRITSEEHAEDWRTLRARPGARFVVGDPKQSIYRFRGADVWTYTNLRDQIASASNGMRLSITTNFRSSASILDFVNETFAAPLSHPSQPGYERLAPTPVRLASRERPSVARMAVTPSSARPSREKTNERSLRDLRRAEADAVARTVAALLEGTALEGHAAYAPDDVALLAPKGTDLDIYESALEEIGVPIASQAGKNHFGQQVTQDLLALCRTLANPSDTLALGALLRGPLLGFTDEELLDALDDAQSASDGAHHVRLRRDMDPTLLRNERLRTILTTLDALADVTRIRTPYQALAHAIDVLNVRAVVRERDPKRSARDLKNLEQVLEHARAFAGRGFHAFTQSMWESWHDGSRERESLPDETEAVVSMQTIHASKGLEWPVVIPINMFGAPQTRTSAIASKMDPERTQPATLNVSQKLDEDDGFRLITSAWHEARQNQELEDRAERVRLWYVVMTRPSELLILPEPVDVSLKNAAWWNVVAWESSHLPWVVPRPPAPRSIPTPRTGAQAAESVPRERYAQATRAIIARRPSYVDVRPSNHERHESPKRSVPESSENGEDPRPRRDGTARGSLVHALFEEIVCGALEADEVQLLARTKTLLTRIENAANIDSEEVTATVLKGWRHPDVAAWHGQLVAEWHLRKAIPHAEGTHIVSGIADAVALDEQGDVALVIDWKSDFAPNEDTRQSYARQLRTYLDVLDAPAGLLVFAARGETLFVERGTP